MSVVNQGMATVCKLPNSSDALTVCFLAPKAGTMQANHLWQLLLAPQCLVPLCAVA
jgi:hypothetical protein